MQENTKQLATYIKNLQFKNSMYKDIITVEHRSNNPKRDYLFVNKIQAKHIPCDVIKTQLMCKDLAHEVNRYWKGNKNILIVGFAETATGLARLIANEVNDVVYFMCTTRENIPNAKDLITFEEEHSHATTQKLITHENNDFDFGSITHILFVEDEISTGNTIINFVKAFQSQDIIRKNVEFGVASICNWQNEADKKRFKDYKIETFALITGELKDVNAKMDIDSSDIRTELKVNTEEKDTVVQKFVMCNTNYFNSRILGDKLIKHSFEVDSYIDNVIDIVLSDISNLESIRQLRDIRVIGTEECMAPAIQVATKLRFGCNNIESVLCHSTTRSKIDILKDSDGLTSRTEVRSAYDNTRQTYIYNIEEYTDLTILVTDADNPNEFVEDIKNKLNTHSIILIHLK